jgi:hypothetical protein
MYLLGLLLWIAASGGLAWLVARLLSRWSSKLWLRPLLTLILLPVVFLAPLSDEIVGKFQFDRLCEEAKEVKIYATHPVGEELYTSEGKWRLGTVTADASRLGEIVESLVRWDHGGTPPQVISGAIVIYQFDTRIYDRKSDRLLAEWRVYSTPGGWLSRQFEVPLLVDPRCDPSATKGWGAVERVLPFKSSKGETK